MKNSRFPNTYVIVASAIVLCAAASWIIPGAKAQTWEVFSALYRGFIKQSEIIIFILTVGAAFWVLNASGAVSAGISRFIVRVGTKDRLVICAITVFFSLAGAVFGMSEETIPFVGIVVPLMISMGYDAFMGMLTVYVAANIGFSAAFLNPFTVGIAQEMSGLPLFSGMAYRIVCWTVLTCALMAYTMHYAHKHRNNIQASEARIQGGTPLGTRHTIILCVLLATVILLIIGVTVCKWYMTEISALFLAMGIICGAVAGFSPNRIADEMVAGAKDILSAAMIVGLASGIIVLMQDSGLMERMLASLENGLNGSGPLAALGGMYGLQAAINMLIPSATAKAAITIPVMAPFADAVGVSRQAMVLAFQFGDGFTNMITPTSGVLLAALGMAGIQYDSWVRKVWKPILCLMAAGFVLLAVTLIPGIPEF